MHEARIPEQIHGLEVAAGNGTVRPGAIVELRFRLRNRRAEPTPPGQLTFLLPAGWAPLGPPESDVPSLGAGEEHVTALLVRAEPGDERRTAFQALLTAGAERYGSNVVAVDVRGRPCFAAPTSGLRVLAGDEVDSFVAAVELLNDGDATARDARVILHPPAGFTVDEPSERLAGDLPPGGSFACSFVVRPAAPPAGVVLVDDARVAYAGGSCALVQSAPFALEPRIELAAEATRAASRLDVALRVANTGWTAAFDVPCRVQIPAGWRIVRGTLLLAQAPVAATTHADGFAAVLPLVDARSAVELTFVACAVRAHAVGSIAITCADAFASVAIDAAERRSVRLAARASSGSVIAGEDLTVTVAAWNDGETDEHALLAADARVVHVESPSVALRAGSAAHATLHVPVPAECVAGLFPVAIRAIAADGTLLGAAQLGACVRVHGAPLFPATLAVAEPVLRARTSAAERVAAGARLDVELRVGVLRAIATLHVRARRTAAAPYIAGTSSVDGHAIVDGPEGPGLFDSGLALHALPAGTTLTVGWAVLPTCGGPCEHVVELCADGELSFAEAAETIVDEAPAFPTRPAGLSYFVDAPTVTRPAERESLLRSSDPLPAAPPVKLTLGLRLDAARRALMLRLLHGSRSAGIASHFPLLGALFPDDVDREDALLRAALGVSGDAVRSVYERLFVKLRIPNYDVSPYDLEDASLRDALVTLLEQSAGAAAEAAPRSSDLSLKLEIGALAAARVPLIGAPLGSAPAIATIASLLPRFGDGAVASALGAYATLLAEELDAARSLGPDAFASYLALHRVDALDEARQRAILALASPDGLAAAR